MACYNGLNANRIDALQKLERHYTGQIARRGLGIDLSRMDEVLELQERPQSLGEEIANSVSHGLGLVAAVAAFPVLVLAAQGVSGVIGASVFAGAMVLMYLTSTLFHALPHCRGKRVLQILDHSAIYVLIAGTYTPFGMVALSDTLAAFLLRVAWGGAAAGITLHVLWHDAPKWVSACVYVAMGWVGIAALPSLVAQTGWTPVALLVVGGLVYSLGALVYAVRRPDPVPAVFGYHEVFHTLVVVAATAHYAAVALAVLA